MNIQKSAIALALLGLSATWAHAQSSVTLFGVIDANVKNVKTGNTSLTKQDTDGNSSSRFGLRGEESLGGDLKAGFWLESAVSPDTGTANAKFWNRRSTVSLTSGSLGEIRLGRDSSPAWNNAVAFDTFGTVGVGTATALYASLGTNVPDAKRNDNAVSYFLPSGVLGGVYGQVQVAAGEGAVAGKAQGFRLGYRVAGFDAAVAQSVIDVTGGKWKQLHAGASYDFRVVKLLGQYSIIKSTAATPERKEKVWELGAIVPVTSAGSVKVGYGKATDYYQATKLAVGYQHDLSRRTALYATWGQIKNKNANAAFVVAGAPAAAVGAQQKSTGYELGLRHAF